MKNKSMLDNYTSTGKKFWKHPVQMNNYKNGNSMTVISTHISPTSRCNLNCKYCSVKKRKPNQIDLKVIKDYVDKLMTRGLKAVILTGGGEPMLYPYFDELTSWLRYEKGLSIGLITNATQSKRVERWDVFSWIRVSINFFADWHNQIYLPLEKIGKETVIGMSYIDGDKVLENVIDALKFMQKKLNASYVRILPNCLYDFDELEKEHQRIAQIFEKHNLKKYNFFHQYKNHGMEDLKICHQAYFRPYLSEVDGGTVYPCDSIVLNNDYRFFHDKYKICKAEDILNFLDKKIPLNFIPQIDCKGCVFHKNIQMLDDWVNNKIDLFEENQDTDVIHEEFV